MKPIAFLVIGAVVVIGGWLIYIRTEPEVETRADAIVIHTWPAQSISIDDITGVSLETSMPRVLDVVGHGLLYLRSAHPPLLKLQMRNDFVYINYREPARTKEVYERITAAINK